VIPPASKWYERRTRCAFRSRYGLLDRQSAVTEGRPGTRRQRADTRRRCGGIPGRPAARPGRPRQARVRGVRGADHLLGVQGVAIKFLAQPIASPSPPMARQNIFVLTQSPIRDLGTMWEAANAMNFCFERCGVLRILVRRRRARGQRHLFRPSSSRARYGLVPGAGSRCSATNSGTLQPSPANALSRRRLCWSMFLWSNSGTSGCQ
jgi:hypothetical protein